MTDTCTIGSLEHTKLEQGRVISNVKTTHEDLFLLTIEVPTCARAVAPGQFVHLELPFFEAHLLRRPFSVYQASVEQGSIALLYQAVGKGTHHMQELKTDDKVSIVGPIGRGWQTRSAQKCLLVGGGVGAAPLYLLACQLEARGAQVEVVLGATQAAQLVCENSFAGRLSNSCVHVCTDDGSRGHKGLVTALAADLLASHTFDYAAVCGPEIMQRLIAEQTLSAGIRTEVSLERRMACGLGACLSCVVDTTSGKQRACVDGPVFDAQEVMW